MSKTAGKTHWPRRRLAGMPADERGTACGIGQAGTPADVRMSDNPNDVDCKRCRKTAFLDDPAFAGKINRQAVGLPGDPGGERRRAAVSMLLLAARYLPGGADWDTTVGMAESLRIRGTGRQAMPDLTRADYTAVRDLPVLVLLDRLAEPPPGLAEHPFGRSGCQPVDGEPLLAARSRGCAAEAAADAAGALRHGDITEARELLRGALTYLDQHDKRMVNT